MDPLSDVLSLLKPRSYISGGFEVGGDMAIKFPKHQGIKCYAVVADHCWLSLEGIPEAVPLGAGDCFLLPSGRPFRLASDLTLAPLDAAAFFPSVRRGGIALCNGGGDFRLGPFLLCRQLIGACRLGPPCIGSKRHRLGTGLGHLGLDGPARLQASRQCLGRLLADSQGDRSC